MARRVTGLSISGSCPSSILISPDLPKHSISSFARRMCLISKPQRSRRRFGRWLCALVKAGAVPAASQEGIIAAILKREQLGATAVGNGVAIPHAKHEAVSRVVGNIGWSQQGIDFDSLDGQKVHLLVLLVSPLDRAGDHLRALEKISQQLRELPRPLVTPSSEM